MDELHLLRKGNLQALQSLIPQASNLDPQTPTAPEKKVANGNWGDAPGGPADGSAAHGRDAPAPVQKGNGGSVWGNTGTAQEQGNPWMQSTPTPKPAEAAKKPQEPPRRTWGDPSPF